MAIYVVTWTVAMKPRLACFLRYFHSGHCSLSSSSLRQVSLASQAAHAATNSMGLLVAVTSLRLTHSFLSSGSPASSQYLRIACEVRFQQKPEILLSHHRRPQHLTAATLPGASQHRD